MRSFDRISYNVRHNSLGADQEKSAHDRYPNAALLGFQSDRFEHGLPTLQQQALFCLKFVDRRCENRQLQSLGLSESSLVEI